MFETIPRIDTSGSLPRHTQVQRILRDMVSSGRLKPGDKIPAETQIAESLGVSKMTVNKALLALTADGVFVREVGRGTFVAVPGIAATDAAAPSASQRLPESSGPLITLSFLEGSKDILESDYYSTLYRGVMDVFCADGQDKVDFRLAPLAVHDYVADEERSPSDGRLIICPRSESIPSILRLWDLGKALVVVGASWPDLAVPSVDSDNVEGARVAVLHLSGLGHRNIALVYAEEEASNSRDRVKGYRLGRSESGSAGGTPDEVCAKESWELGQAARRDLTEMLTRSRNPVTAIFAGGFTLALESMNAVRAAGLRVPEDVSVVGYDDPLSAHLVYPPLTTIRQPLREMGRRAAERLLRRIGSTEETHRVIHESLQSHLIVRGSTAPVRSVNDTCREPPIMALQG